MALTPGQRVLIIPAGAATDDQAYAHRAETWQDLADEAGATPLAADHPDVAHVGGLGVWVEPEPWVDPGPPAPSTFAILLDALAAARTLDDVAEAAEAARLAGGI